jgi:hypothetical protein
MFKHVATLLTCATVALCTTAFGHNYDVVEIDDEGNKVASTVVGPTQSYKTIQAAVNDLSKLDAKTSASIRIDEGTYNESVTITIPSNIDGLRLKPSDFESYPTVNIYGVKAPAITLKGGKSTLTVLIERLWLYAPDNSTQNVALKNTATISRMDLNAVIVEAKNYGNCIYGVYDNSNKVNQLFVNPGCDFMGANTGIWTNALNPKLSGNTVFYGSDTWLDGFTYAVYFSRQRGGSATIENTHISSPTRFQKTVSIKKAETLSYTDNTAWMNGKANAIHVVNSSNDKLSFSVKNNYFGDCYSQAWKLEGRNITTTKLNNTSVECPLP